ncbi:MAG TPA: hypothetical protein VJG32_21375 [Anaerolineae bacterium]|nr:hypothetical protein [Anaerolineae bacterium]
MTALPTAQQRHLIARPDKHVIFLVAVWLFGLIILFKPWVHGTDPVGYYSWLRSAVIDGDLDTTNEYIHYGEDKNGIIFPGPTGYNKNPYAVGSAILWSPFFLVAHAISLIFGLPADGYAPLYVVAASCASAMYALLGLGLTYRMGRELFDARIAAWATIGIWWATPLLFYMYSHPIMSHANDAFANALFVYTWFHTRQSPATSAEVEPAQARRIRSNRGWLLLGGALGLAALVRTQNGLLITLPLVEGVLYWRSVRRIDLRAQLKPIALFGLAALIVFSPQFVAWQQTYGTIVPGNPYAVYGDAFNFASPHFFDVLLSSARGLFVWSPLVALAIVGWLLYLSRADRVLGIGLGLTWLAQVYLIGSWSAWSGAVSFGQRFMINGTPIYLLGLAALLAHLRDRVGWRAIGLSIIAFVVWNLLLIAQYIVELIPRAGPVDLGQMFLNQFRVIGIVFERLGSLLAARFGRLR